MGHSASQQRPGKNGSGTMCESEYSRGPGGGPPSQPPQDAAQLRLAPPWTAHTLVKERQITNTNVFCLYLKKETTEG